MHTIYIGYSKTLNSEKMIEYFDIDDEHSEMLSKFEQNHKCDYLDSGTFEVYGKNDFPGEPMDAKLFLDLVPFSMDLDELNQLDFENGKSFFFVIINKISSLVSKDATFFGPIKIEKLEFE